MSVSVVGGGVWVVEDGDGLAARRTAALRGRAAGLLRRALPVDPALAQAREDLEAADARLMELEEERDALAARVEVLTSSRDSLAGRLDDALENERVLSYRVHQLLEPVTSDRCSKIRLRTESEAWVFSDALYEENGSDTEPYKCPFCPRQPWPRSNPPFWHIRNVDPKLRGEAGRIARGAQRHRERLQGQHLTHRICLPPMDQS